MPPFDWLQWLILTLILTLLILKEWQVRDLKRQINNQAPTTEKPLLSDIQQLPYNYCAIFAETTMNTTTNDQIIALATRINQMMNAHFEKNNLKPDERALVLALMARTDAQYRRDVLGIQGI